MILKKERERERERDNMISLTLLCEMEHSLTIRDQCFHEVQRVFQETTTGKLKEKGKDKSTVNRL